RRRGLGRCEGASGGAAVAVRDGLGEARQGMPPLRVVAACAALFAAGGASAIAVPVRLAAGAAAEGGGSRPPATPEAPKLKLRVGESQTSAVASPAPDARFRWALDDQTTDTGAQWTWVPTAADVGAHVVSLDAGGSSGAATRRWLVRVIPPHLP